MPVKVPAAGRRAGDRARGFSLIEALIAAFLVAVSLMALAQMHTKVLHEMRGALWRATAAELARDLAEQVRANASPADSYDCQGVCQEGMGGNAVAVADLAAWRAEVTGRLPDGAGAVAFDSGTGTSPARYTIAVSWIDWQAPGHRATVTLAMTL